MFLPPLTLAAPVFKKEANNNLPTIDYRRRALRLQALARDQAGKPEGEVARRKLEELLRVHPELMEREKPEARPAIPTKRQMTPEEREALKKAATAWVDFFVDRIEKRNAELQWEIKELDREKGEMEKENTPKSWLDTMIDRLAG